MGILKMGRVVAILLLVLLAGSVRAELPGILSWETEQNLETVYREVYLALEKNSFFVVFEANIGRNLAGFSMRWGDEYNRNQLQDIRSMVFCNAWYTNQISNIEPALLALCPLKVSLYRQGTVTRVVFVRPTHTGRGSPAEKLLEQLEADVSAAIQQGVDEAEKRPFRRSTTR
jgi:uncharacterized protein (DUF302 family)